MKLGVAHVKPAYGPRTLVDDAQAIASLGFHCVKLHMSNQYTADYPAQSWGATPTSLTTLAQTTPFATVFGDSRLTDFVLNVWTFANGTTNPWTQAVHPSDGGEAIANLAAEQSEIQALAAYLLATYPGKRFVLQQSEADWALLGQASDTARYQAEMPHYRAGFALAFFRARQRGVEAARAASNSSAVVQHGIEVNLALDAWGPRIHRDVLPFFRPDVVGFSSYECIITAIQTGDQATVQAEIDRRFRQEWGQVQAACPGVDTYVGEFAWPENESWFQALVSGGLSVDGIIGQVVTTCAALGMSLCVFWQHRDNEEQSPGVPRGFYVRKPDGNLSAQGQAFIARL